MTRFSPNCPKRMYCEGLTEGFKKSLSQDLGNMNYYTNA